MNEKITIFFSWQSNKPEVRKIISAELSNIKKALSAEGYDVEIDQDTRGRVGTKNIESDVLEKIERCDIFVADLTPIVSVETVNNQVRLLPNPNVIYECGYAVAQKGLSRMILLSYLTNGETIEQLPFDINHNTITNIREQQIKSLYNRIKTILIEVEWQRRQQKKEYECDVLFTENKIEYERITIRPRYKKIQYEMHDASQSDTLKTPPTKIGMSSIEMMSSYFSSIQKTGSFTPPQNLINVKTYSQIINHASCPIQMVVTNIGECEIENIYLFVEIDTPGVVFSNDNTEYVGLGGNFKRYDYIIEDKNSLKAHIKELNPDMMHPLDSVYMEIPFGVESVTLKWSVIAARHKQQGTLVVDVVPEYEGEVQISKNKAGQEEIVPYLEYK